GVVHNAELQPQGLRANRDRLVGNRRNFLAVAEHVDQVDALMACRLGEADIGRLAQHLARIRIHGNDPPAMRLHVARHFMAGAVRLGRQADHSDGAAAGQDLADGFGFGHGRRSLAARAVSAHSLAMAARISATVGSWGSSCGAWPAWYSTYTGTPLRPSWPIVAVMAGSRRVQSARSNATFLAARSASTAGFASVVRWLYWQVTHQAAVKSTSTGRPVATIWSTRPGSQGCQRASLATAGVRANGWTM